MWKFQVWNRCDSHVRIGVIDLVRDVCPLCKDIKRLQLHLTLLWSCTVHTFYRGGQGLSLWSSLPFTTTIFTSKETSILMRIHSQTEETPTPRGALVSPLNSGAHGCPSLLHQWLRIYLSNSKFLLASDIVMAITDNYNYQFTQISHGINVENACCMCKQFLTFLKTSIRCCCMPNIFGLLKWRSWLIICLFKSSYIVQIQSSLESNIK